MSKAIKIPLGNIVSPVPTISASGNCSRTIFAEKNFPKSPLSPEEPFFRAEHTPKTQTKLTTSKALSTTERVRMKDRDMPDRLLCVVLVVARHYKG